MMIFPGLVLMTFEGPPDRIDVHNIGFPFYNHLVYHSAGQICRNFFIERMGDEKRFFINFRQPFQSGSEVDHIADNRVLRDFTCVERKQFRILPLCDANGVVPEISD